MSTEPTQYEIITNPLIGRAGLFASDINSVEGVNLVDPMHVSQNFGPVDSTVPRVDANTDGTVNISDLIIVA